MAEQEQERKRKRDEIRRDFKEDLSDEVVDRIAHVREQVDSDKKKIERILQLAKTEEKPNFTQYQLMLMELEAEPEDYKQLRISMEQKFKLRPMEEILA